MDPKLKPLQLPETLVVRKPCRLLIIDEAAHIDGLDDLWTGLYPTLSTGGRCIALSTPNGVGNWFHKTYIVSADNGESDFKPVELTVGCSPRKRPSMV